MSNSANKVRLVAREEELLQELMLYKEKEGYVDEALDGDAIEEFFKVRKGRKLTKNEKLFIKRNEGDVVYSGFNELYAD